MHGAVVIPRDVADKVPEAAAGIARRERVIIDASQEEGRDRTVTGWGGRSVLLDAVEQLFS